MLYFVGVLFVLAGVNAGPSTCPQAEPMKNFDFKKYGQGRWYEVGRYDQPSFEQGADCVWFDYTTEGGKTYVTSNEVINKKVISYKWSVSLAPDAAGSAKMIYTVVKNLGENVNVYILDTDYTNYSIFYACAIDPATNAPKEYSWVKSREPTMKPEVQAKVEAFVKSHPFVDESRMVFDHFSKDDCLTT